jgi:hypothetical protein
VTTDDFYTGKSTVPQTPDFPVWLLEDRGGDDGDDGAAILHAKDIYRI